MKYMQQIISPDQWKWTEDSSNYGLIRFQVYWLPVWCYCKEKKVSQPIYIYTSVGVVSLVIGRFQYKITQTSLQSDNASQAFSV